MTFRLSARTRSVQTRTGAAALLASLVLAIGLAGCSPPPGPSTPAEVLPPAPEVLAKASDTMAKIKTVGVDVQVDQALSALPIRSATGKLTAAGESQGSVVIAQGNSNIEFQFVVAQGALYLKGATGGFQPLPLAMAASVYDPTALMRPDTGIAALLRTATGAVTEASDDVNGAPVWRIRAALDPQIATSVVPGLSGAANGVVWIEKSTSRLLKAQVQVPVDQTDPKSPTAPVTVSLADFDAPVTITAPPVG
ncbi:MAG TPA: LppX_LprAFG lipoprotein [Pseudonocardia sp.]